MGPSRIAAGLFRSSATATLSQLLRMAALLFTHAAVRRFIGPEEWGHWDWIQPILLFLAAVRDLGVPSHVLRLRPMPLKSLLRIEAGWGGALALGVLLGAPWIAGLAAAPSPDLPAALQVLMAYLLLEGLTAVLTVWFEAHLELERTLSAELLRTAVYCGSVLALSSLGIGLWSFVTAQVASQAIYWIALRTQAARNRVDLTVQAASTLGLLRASWGIGTVWLLSLIVQSLDPFLLGLQVDTQQVGLYAAAYFLAFLVYRVLQAPLGRALYPALIAYRTQPARQFEAFRLVTGVFLIFEVPTAFALALNSERVLALYAGSRYLEAGGLLQLLAFAPLVDPWSKFGGEYLLALHADRARVVSLGLNLVALAGLGWWWSSLWGPEGMAWANFVPAGAPVVLWVLAKTGGKTFRNWLLELGMLYFLPGLLFLPVWWMTPSGSSLRFGASAVAALISAGLLLSRYLPRLAAFLREELVVAAQDTGIPKPSGSEPTSQV